MSYIEDEQIIGNGTATQFTLDDNFKPGTIKVIYDDVVFYEYRELYPNKLVFDFPPTVDNEIYVNYLTADTPNTFNAIRYCTPKQVIDICRSEITGVAETTIEKIIREAELLVDSYCGYWEKLYAETNQKRTFPRKWDSELYEYRINENYSVEYGIVPERVTKGTIYAVEYLYLKGTPSASNLDDSIYESERLGDYNYTKKMDKQLEAGAKIGANARAMLRGYTNRSGKLNIEMHAIGSEQGLLNSRQKFIN